MQVSAPSADALTEELFCFSAYLMRHTQGAVFDVAAELDLTFSQLRALFVLAHCETPPALNELAPCVGLSVAACGRVIDALVRDDVVARREDEADRRIKRLSLTAHGEEVLERLAAARREGLRQFAETLTDEQRARFSHALAPVLDRFTPHP